MSERIRINETRTDPAAGTPDAGNSALEGFRAMNSQLMQVARNAIAQTTSRDNEAFLQSNRQTSAQ